MKSHEEIIKGLTMCSSIIGRCYECPYENEEYCSRNMMIDAVERINQHETQLAALRKKGHWLSETDHVTGDTGYSCSECDRAYWFNDGNPIDNHYHFCPNCGAIMSMMLFGGDC